MLRGILILFLSLTLVSSSYAITEEQLNAADDILRQMDSKISVLRGYVQVAARGKVRGITLTAGQKNTLKDSYTDEKSELTTLFNQLP